MPLKGGLFWEAIRPRSQAGAALPPAGCVVRGDALGQVGACWPPLGRRHVGAQEGEEEENKQAV